MFRKYVVAPIVMACLNLVLSNAAFSNPAPPVVMRPVSWIFSLVDSGEVKLVAQELERDRSVVTETDNEGRSLLHRAAIVGNKDMMRVLLAKPFDVNAEDSFHRTPLQMAANGETAKLLLDRGASIAATGPHRRNALHWATIHRAKPTVEALLVHGANVMDPDANGNTALHFAADTGSVDITAILIARGAVIDARDRDGRTPLLRAACNGDRNAVAVVQKLLANGAEINASGNGGCQNLGGKFSSSMDGSDPSSKGGFTPLHVAVFRGELDLSRVLVDNKADVNRISEKGWTPLHLAAVSARTDLAEVLLSHGAAVNVGDHIGATPLHWTAAASNGSVGLDLSWSWIRDTEASGRRISGESYLTFAGQLIAGKADVNAVDANGRTPLALAAKEAAAELVPTIEEYSLLLRKKHEAMADLLRGAGGHE